MCNCLRISDEWVRFLKVVDTNDNSLLGKTVFKFSNNILIVLGCNVY